MIKNIFNIKMAVISPPSHQLIDLLLLFTLLLLMTSKTEAAFLTVDCTNPVHIATLEIPQVECETLEELWTDTNGANWDYDSNWDTLNKAKFWHGISVTAGNVTRLDLEDNDLAGTIPNLNGLTSLMYLFLQDNQLTGTIPDLNSLTSLERLDLTDNQLTGTIPEVSALTSLQYFDLADNQLTGSIPDLSTLTSLKGLELDGNQLIGSMPDLSNATDLWEVYLSHNQLTGTIPDLSGLTDLRYLFLQGNQLSGPIPDLTSLPLVQFKIHYNSFEFSDFETEHISYLTNTFYPYGYSPQAAVDSDRTEVMSNGSPLTLTPEISINPSGNDSYQWYKDGSAINTVAGVQRVYSVTVASSMDLGKYTYTVNNSVVTNLTLASHSGTNAITVVMLGDCTGDGMVDIGDIICTINLVLSNSFLDAADIDDNQVVDINDVIGTINIVLAP